MVDKDFIPTLQQLQWFEADLEEKLDLGDNFLDLKRIDHFNWDEPKWFVTAKEIFDEETGKGILREFVVEVENNNGEGHPLYIVNVEAATHGHPVMSTNVCFSTEFGEWTYEDEDKKYVEIV